MKFKKLLFILTIFISSNQVHSNPKGFNVVAANDHKPLALVIGNGSYQYAPLRNTINDAVDIAAVLRQMGQFCIGGCKTTPLPANVFQDRLRTGGFAARMTWIPAGSVVMANKPVGIGRFAMGVYEVTVSEYLRFVKSTSSHLPEWQKYANVSRVKRYYSKLGAALKGGNYPIVGISWHDAKAYTKWLSQQTGHNYLLPTESQWEYAARAGSQSIRLNKANCFNCGDSFRYTAPVGSFAVNPFGLYDMLGNVQEWTCSEYQYKYRGKEQTCVKKNRVNRTRLVLRGGSWDSRSTKITNSNRAKWSASTCYATVGFRVVRLMN